MRDLFPEFNKPTEEGFKKLWNEAIFVFDTNVLLGLYRLPERARKKLLSILRKLKQKNQIWIPFQFAMEYYRNRPIVLHDREKIYREIIDSIKDVEKRVGKCFDSEKFNKKFSEHLKAIETEMEKAKSKHCDWLKSDIVEVELNKILKNKIGPPYDNETLNDIYKKGDDRYAKEIPPGYKDIEKDKKDKTKTYKYGDFVAWCQIIEMAKKEKKPIILVTDEQEEDWWWKVGENKSTNIGARHELIKEMKDAANVIFHMYQTDDFIKHAITHLSMKADKKIIDQIKQSRVEAIKEGILAESGQSVSALPSESSVVGMAFPPSENVNLAETIASIPQSNAPISSGEKPIEADKRKTRKKKIES